MAEYGPNLNDDIARFRQRVLASSLNILDPPNVHHEFVRGAHARKLDFDKIKTDSDLYIQWISIFARAIKAVYKDTLPDALVGVANGANRLAESIAPLLGKTVLDLTTQKSVDGRVFLDEQSRETYQEGDISSVLVIDDVGTTGSTAAFVVEELFEFSEPASNRVEVFNGWQRSETLPELDKLQIAYHAVILSPLPKFSPEECQEDPVGYCAQGIPLVPYAR